MFQFYANLLSVDTKYAWNKIVHKQTQSDTYTDLQGFSRKGPRGLLRKSFDNCVMFHLLTVFPNNAVEQESQTCLRNPSVSACIILCSMWSISLLHCSTTMLTLQPLCQAQCISCKCTIHWGWSGKSRSSDVPTYMAGPLQPSRERHDSHGHAFASYDSWGYWVCMHTGKVQCTIQRESFQQGQERKQETWYWVYGQSPQKSLHSIALQPLQEEWGMYTMHNTRHCCKYEKNRLEKADFHAAKKGGKKPNTTRNSSSQMSKKLGKLKKAIKKQCTKSKKHCRDNSDSNSDKQGIWVG